jgi:hypothetical protein
VVLEDPGVLEPFVELEQAAASNPIAVPAASAAIHRRLI